MSPRRELGSIFRFVFAIWVGLGATIFTGQVQAQTWTFGTCSSDIRSFFKIVFPEFESNRRLRVLEESNPAASFERTLFSRTQKLYRTEFPSTPPPSQGSTTAASATGDEEDGIVGRGAFGRIPKPKPTADSYLPPIGAWDQARMAASGCGSCANGCCDAVDIQLDCGTMQVPLNYTNPGGAQITLSVYRVRLVTPQFLPSNRTHLWVLQGGPGGSGLSILPLAIPSLQFATDIYVPDHRGTAFSEELKCPTQQAPSSIEGSAISTSEVSGCYTSGSAFVGADFKTFTVTAAAQDLEKMITSARSLFAPKAVFVHGYSYGTRWAQRFLQIFPNVADKVVLEGVVAKDTVFNDFAVGSQIAGTRFMEKCLANSKCSQFFSSTSLASTINSITSQGRDNICSILTVGSQVSSAAVREVVQVLLYGGLVSGVDGPFKDVPGFDNQELFVDFRTFNLALIHHWKNCQTEKNFRAFAAGLAYVLSLNGGLTGRLLATKNIKPSTALEEQDLFNDIVYNMIAYSDLRRYPMDAEPTYNAATQNVDWGPVLDFDVELALSNAWGDVKYPSDGFMGGSPTNVQSELLIINGEIDGQTPRPQAFATFNDITMAGGVTKTIACIRDQGHHSSGFGCGLNVAKSFYAGTPDTSCAMTNPNEAIQPLSTNFDIPEPFSNTLLGLSAPFDGSEVSDFCGPATTGPSGEQACDRCLDYCIFRADNADRSYCSCLSDLAQCYARAGLSDPSGTCRAMKSIYDSSFNTEVFPGCSSACTVSGFGLTVGEIVLIVLGAGMFMSLAVVARYVVVRKRKQPAAVQGQIVMAIPVTSAAGPASAVRTSAAVAAVPEPSSARISVPATPVTEGSPPNNTPY